MDRRFPTTRWTLILKAGDGNQDRRNEALEALCRAYWPPVYAYIRSRGTSRAEAEDLTQGFFQDFLARDEFTRVDSAKGKLRTFLLSSVTNYMAKDRRSRNRQRRGGDCQILPLEVTNAAGESRILEPEDHVTPETLFERQWALTVLSNVIEDLENRFEEKGRGDLFRALRFTISPAGESESYASIAERLGLTESTVKVSAHRLRELYRSQLRETIADTVLDDADIEEELQCLYRAFAEASS